MFNSEQWVNRHGSQGLYLFLNHPMRCEVPNEMKSVFRRLMKETFQEGQPGATKDYIALVKTWDKRIKKLWRVADVSDSGIVTGRALELERCLGQLKGRKKRAI